MNKKTKTPKYNGALAMERTNMDIKNSILIVSIVVNLIVLTTWLVAKVSAAHAAQLVNLI